MSKGRDIFYGVVAIATLIVALIGATLAYFSITASSANGVVNARAAIVSINYEDGKQVTAQADELIPATWEVVRSVYESKITALTEDDFDAESETACIDDNGRQVCSTYRFSIGIDDPLNISAYLNTENNGFVTKDLSYAVYDLVNEKWIDLVTSGDSTKQYVRMDYACNNPNLADEEKLDDPDGEVGAKLPDCYTGTGDSKVYDKQFSLFGTTIADGKTTVNSRNDTEQSYELVLFLLEPGEGNLVKNQNIDQGKSFSGTIYVTLSDTSSLISGYVAN